MYVLKPPQGWDEFRKSPRPLQKVDSNGDPMFERLPRPGKPREPLLNFMILPDVIGTEEPWCYFEAIRRIDPQVRWTDITMRMPLESRPSENSLNQNGVRNRQRNTMLSWHPNQFGQAQNARRTTVMAMLTTRQIAGNTSRGATPGLIDPVLGEAGGRIPIPIQRRRQGVRQGPRQKAVPVDLEAEKSRSENEDSEWDDEDSERTEKDSEYKENSRYGHEESELEAGAPEHEDKDKPFEYEDEGFEHNDSDLFVSSIEGADDLDLDAQGADNESSDEDAGGWVESTFSSPNQSAATVQRNKDLANRWKAGRGMFLEGTNHVAYDRRGLGKSSRTPVHVQLPEPQAPKNRGKKRKTTPGKEQSRVFPPKKRVCARLHEVPRNHGPIIHPSDLGGNNAYTQLLETRPPISAHATDISLQQVVVGQKAPCLDWHRIEHATPYDLDSRANFFCNSGSDTTLVVEPQSHDTGSGDPPSSGYADKVTCSTPGRVAEPVYFDPGQSLQPETTEKRKYSMVPEQSHDYLNMTPKSYCPAKTRKEPAMIFLPAVVGDKRKRGHDDFTPDLEDANPMAKKPKILASPVINYHYPPVIPVWDCQHRDEPAREHLPKEFDVEKWFHHDPAIPEDPPLVIRDGLRMAEAESRMSSEQQEKSRRLSLLEFRRQVLAGLAFDWLD